MQSSNPLGEGDNRYAEYKTQLSPELSFKNNTWRVSLALPLT